MASWILPDFSSDKACDIRKSEYHSNFFTLENWGWDLTDVVSDGRDMTFCKFSYVKGTQVTISQQNREDLVSAKHQNDFNSRNINIHVC